MSQFDDLIRQLSTNDTKKKLTVGQNIIDYLGDPENSTECEDLSGFIDSLVPWMQSSNFKVSQNGLDIVGLLIERLGYAFKSYVNTVIGAAVDRLGDTREIVREKAVYVLNKLMQDVLEPQTLFEKIGQPAFMHKNGKVREEVLVLLQTTLNQYGTQVLLVSRFLPWVVALLSDPTAPVRDAASNTLVEIYRHVGERVRADIQSKHNLPPAKLAAVLGRFDTIKSSGEMMPTADGTVDGNRADDETDRQSVKSATSVKSRSSSVPANRRQQPTFSAPKPPSGDDVRLLMSDIIEELQNVKTQTRSTERRACMTQLIRMTREDQAAVIQENFRTVLRLLLENLSDEVGATRALVFGVLTEMLKQSDLISSFQSYTELIILKVLEAHRDVEKDVERAAEGCAAAMAGVLPSDTVIGVLNPIIKTGDYPVNQAAIKMMTKVAEHEENKETIIANLGDIMPGLLKAYDNVESSVRKASVFCMVSMHQVAGEQLQPHLSSLNGSKLKLLNLYIKRAQAQAQQLSMPASPRMATPP